MGTATMTPSAEEVKEDRTQKGGRLKENLHNIKTAYEELSTNRENKEDNIIFLATRFAYGEKEEKVKIRGYLSILLHDDPITCKSIIDLARDFEMKGRSNLGKKGKHERFKKYPGPDWL
jgi:hypothetical protein